MKKDKKVFRPRLFASRVSRKGLDDFGASGITFEVDSLVFGKIYEQEDPRRYGQDLDSKPFLVNDNGCTRYIDHKDNNFVNDFNEVLNHQGCRMINMDELYQRYPDLRDRSIIGNKPVYRINDNIGFHINKRDGGEIIRDEKNKGYVETFRIMGGDIINTGFKRLDSFYNHPFYTTKHIIKVELLQHLPYIQKGSIIEVKGINNDDFGSGWVSIGQVDYKIHEILTYPEFFKPLYS